MPLKTLDPYYVDALGVSGLLDTKLGYLESVEGATLTRTGTQVLMVTPEWYSPSVVGMRGAEINVPYDGFPQNHEDADGDAICGSALYKEATWSGSITTTSGSDEDEVTDTLTYGGGANTVAYHVADGEVTTVEDTHATYSHTHTGEPDAEGDQFGYGPLSKVVSGTRSEGSGGTGDSTVVVLSTPLTAADQLAALTTAADQMVSRLTTTPADAVGIEGIGDVMNPKSDAAYGTVQGSVFACFTPHYSTGAVLRLTVGKYPMQGAVGAIGTGTIKLQLSGSDSRVLRDAFGAYSPIAPGLDDIPWRLISSAVGSMEVKWTSLDSRAWRITAREYSRDSGWGTVHLYVTNPSGAILETAPASFSGLSLAVLEAPFTDDSAPPEGVDSLVVTKAEFFDVTGLWVDVGAASNAVSQDIGTPVVMQLRGRQGLGWGIAALDGTTSQVYTRATLTIEAALSPDDDADDCDCGEQASGSMKYVAVQDVDTDNGALKLVETTINEGRFMDASFLPFVDRAWPLLPGMIVTTASLSEGVVNNTDFAGCNVGDLISVCPEPTETTTDLVLSSFTPGSGDVAALSQFVSFIPADTSAREVHRVIDMKWAKSGA